MAGNGKGTFFLGTWNVRSLYRAGSLAGTCEYGDEPSGSKNAGNFLTSCKTS